jgi:hypothetical protein
MSVNLHLNHTWTDFETLLGSLSELSRRISVKMHLLGLNRPRLECWSYKRRYGSIFACIADQTMLGNAGRGTDAVRLSLLRIWFNCSSLEEVREEDRHCF